MRLGDYLRGAPPRAGYDPDQEQLILAKERYHLQARGLSPDAIADQLIAYVNAYRRYRGVTLLSADEEATIRRNTLAACRPRTLEEVLSNRRVRPDPPSE